MRVPRTAGAVSPQSARLAVALQKIALLSGSRQLTGPRAALHAITHSRRDRLTAVWNGPAPGCGMRMHEATVGGAWVALNSVPRQTKAAFPLHWDQPCEAVVT
ncbi:hypothetical protein AAFF_G00403740 [Aldrovandia affinis]|uniref:Uncharacterized protein n=1 Tax=Aldrovandia affinis TaxID=143900 RepID=A0AAD7T7M4_9TELE|nr:hypothetical protein AAFF_G00403740 [Aldrovandia affinis]